MLDSNLATKIRHAVDVQFDEQIAFTSELVKFTSMRGAEQSEQDFIAASLRECGYGGDMWALQVAELSHLPGFSPVTAPYDNALNVVGAHRPKNKQGQSLILKAPLTLAHSPAFGGERIAPSSSSPSPSPTGAGEGRYEVGIKSLTVPYLFCKP